MIVDELHSLVPTKRSTLRIDFIIFRYVITDSVQRIGISATMEPLEKVAEYLVSSDDREKPKR